MSVLPSFEHLRPADLHEALDAISFDDPVYAGGTELLLAMRSGLLRPSSLIDIKRIPELDRIGQEDDDVVIGGTVSHAAATADPVVLSAAPVLPKVLAHVGNPRVRAFGTLGGNLCFAEPKSDVATILISLSADVELASKNGRRRLPVEDFIIGPYTTARNEGEILVSILIPPTADPMVYEKFQTMERPTVGVAARLLEDGSLRVVVGAVGGAPEPFDFSSVHEVNSGHIADRVEVIPDLTGSERYKRHVTRVVLGRTLAQLEGLA